jgi:hypothetical protein
VRRPTLITLIALLVLIGVAAALQLASEPRRPLPSISPSPTAT